MITFQVTMDCADPDRLARFWAELLGYKLEDPPHGFDSWDAWLREMKIPEEKWNDFSALVDPEGKRARFFFQRVPEPKVAKNRVHLDVNAGGPRGTPPEERAAAVKAAVERATGIGARVLYEKEEMGSHWVTLADPEGNEFCIQ
jgi:catechol 2,3-dioxygenase-like lactoylglutathione lyase family enzyme